MERENNHWTTLKEKFWMGETSLEEDRQLKTHYTQEAAVRELDPDEQYFVLLALEEEELLGDRFDEEMLQKISAKPKAMNWNAWYFRAAAIVLLALTIGLFQYLRNDQVVVNPIVETPVNLEDDPELAKAFEQTKQALLLVSTKLNKGQEQTMLLGKFDHAQQHVKYTIEQ